MTLEDNGRCYSPKFLANDYSDCTYVSGPNGEIGYFPECMYYRKGSKPDFFKGDEIYKSRIENDCKQLAQIVKEVRSNKGNYEDILQVMMKLQSSSYSYQQYCEEKLRIEEDSKDGKKEKR